MRACRECSTPPRASSTTSPSPASPARAARRAEHLAAAIPRIRRHTDLPSRSASGSARRSRRPRRRGSPTPRWSAPRWSTRWPPTSTSRGCARRETRRQVLDQVRALAEAVREARRQGAAVRRMNWISEWALPKIKTLFGGPREVPDNLWDKCPDCEQMIFHRDLERAPPRLHALRPPHADRRQAAPRLHARPRLAAHRAAARPGRPAALPRPAPLRRPAEGRAGARRPGGRGGGGARRDRGPPRGVRGLRVRLPRRLHGRGRGRGAGDGGAARRAAGQPAGGLHRLGRRADAGRRDLADADAAHRDRHPHGEGGRAAAASSCSAIPPPAA